MIFLPSGLGIIKPASAGGGGGDPLWANVTLLLNMLEANGATTLIDNSASAFSVSGQGGAVITTAQSPFVGGGSLDLSGTAGAKRGEIASAANAGFAFAAGDYCVECWIRYVSGQGEPSWHILDANQTGTSRFLLRYNGATALQWYINGTVRVQASVAFTSGTWYHVAVTRSGNDHRLFVGGVQKSTANDSVTMNTGSTALYIGNSTNGDQWGGQVGPIRFTKGAARYTSNFTPPTAVFPTS
jgi:hypothetical protein